MIKITTSKKKKQGYLLHSSSLKVDYVLYRKNKDNLLVLTRHKATGMYFAFDPRYLKLEQERCWCCGSARIRLLKGHVDGEHKDKVVCYHSNDEHKFKCKYWKLFKNKQNYCYANGKMDGNCKGKCPLSKK